MRYLIVALALALCSCATETKIYPPNLASKRPFKARVTYYRKGEDKYGTRIAMSSKMRASEGTTAAADSQWKFGQKFEIDKLSGIVGTGVVEKQDVGTDVERRKASHGQLPVIDIFVASRKKYRWLLNHMEPILDVIPL